MTPLYLSIKEAAHYAGIGENAFRAMVDLPGAPVLRVGNVRYVERDGIAPFLRSMQGGGTDVERQR